MKISIIITTYNRAGHLNRGLYTVLNQKVKPDEILIIDDGSTDHTRQVVENFQKECPFIRYIYNHRLGYKGSALPKNIGIKQATGELLIFTEPECLHLGGVLSQHIAHHEKRDNLFVSSGTVYFVFASVIKSLSLEHFRNPSKILEIQPIVEWRDGYQPQHEDIAVSRKVSALYCASVRKDDLMAIGGFDERYKKWGWEDIDLQSRLGMVGIQCISDENIQLIHLAHGYTTCFENWYCNKKLHEDPNKPVVANQGKEWGVVRK